MNCHGPVKNQWWCNIFPLVRVCLLVLWLSTWSPLLTAWGRVRGKKRWFPAGGCFPVAAEMCCASRGPEWRFSLDCWPTLQIFAERGGGFGPFASSRGHNLQHTAGWSVTKIPGPLTWLKEELPKRLSFHYCCHKIWRNDRRMSLRMVTLGHVHLWHWSQQMPREEYRNRASTYETFLPLILSPQPLATFSSGQCLFRQ